ncbi:MAG: amino acid adenylation domain-containing protein, partial [bacterium]
TAVVFRGNRLNYRELNERANRMASLLREKYHVRPDDLVGLILDRSEWMIVSIFGILKAGGAYLPIEPDLPLPRIQYMLDDAESPVVITTKSREGEFKTLARQNKLVFIEDLVEEMRGAPGGNPERVNKPADLVYVMYTSGSTGMPKGVLVEQRNVVRLVKDTNYTDIKPGDNLLQLSTYAFDGSTYDIFGALLNGAALHVAPKDVVLSLEALCDFIAENKINVTFMTPVLFNKIIDIKPETIGSFDKMYLGGQTLSPKHMRKAAKYRKSEDSLVNAYGPTEATTFSNYYVVREVGETDTSIPIGAPLSNSRSYVLDEKLRPVPIGVEGEIYLGGDGIARGYLNNEELTAEKFIDSPFVKGDRLYRTGDFGRWTPDGQIEFFGRKDEQVKVRGFRIEPGEIETCLMKHGAVKQAFVTSRRLEDEAKELVAYMVGGEEKLDVFVIRDYLSRNLPGYMIPSYFIQLEELPLNKNGKVDKTALPQPDEAGVERGTEYVAPGNETEKAIASVWESVLGQKNIGINDNYFVMGGDSIKAIQVISRLNQSGLKLEMIDFFRHPTIAELALRVSPVEQVVEEKTVEGPVPLSPVQKWFFERAGSEQHHFNQAVLLGGKPGFQPDALRETLKAIQEHHDALRMQYVADGSNGKGPIQRYAAADMPLSFDVVDLRNSEDALSEMERHAGSVQAGMDLERGPLMKAALYRLRDGDRLLIAIHHLVVDGVSWRIILEDLNRGYGRAVEGKPVALPAKTASFKTWVNRLYEHAKSGAAGREREYWRGVAAAGVNRLPGEGKGGKNLVKDSLEVTVELSEDETESLLRGANRAYGTRTEDIMLAALGRVLGDWAGGAEMPVLLEGHGREPLAAGVDVGRTVGWFTCMYPVLLELAAGDDPGRRIKMIKESLKKVPGMGISYGVLRHIECDKELARSEWPEIVFNYLGQFDEDVKSEWFSLANEPHGEPVSPDHRRAQAVEINAMAVGGRMRVGMSFDGKRFGEETIRKIAEDYRRALVGLIEHCRGRTEREMTPGDFSRCELSLDEYESLLSENSWDTSDIEDIYVMTPMQEGLLFQSLFEPESHAYFERLSYRAKGDFKIDLFEKSWNELFSRHAVLRTAFVGRGLARPHQVVLKNRKIEVKVEDLSDVDKQERRRRIEEYTRRDRERGFDLNNDVLMRAAIFKTGDSSHRVVLSYHHILMDGWCLGILHREFIQIYRALLEGKKPELPPVTPYSEYILWRQNRDVEGAGDYWARYLSGYTQPATLPRFMPAGGAAGYEPEEFSFELDESTSRRLRKFAASEGITLNSVFQSIWGVVLSQYSGMNDMVFGTIVSGRPPELKDVENMIGLFINAVPVRIRLDRGQPFAEFALNVQKTSLEAEPWQHFPLAEIQARCAAGRNTFDHILIFENYPLDRELAREGAPLGAGFTIGELEFREETHYDFNVFVFPEEKIQIKFSYNANVYPGWLVERIGEHVRTAMADALSHPQKPACAVQILPDDELEKILRGFNDTRSDYDRGGTIVDLFEEQAMKTPDKEAVLFKDARLTYRELNESANRIAHFLRDNYGIRPDDVVGLLLGRSEWLVAGILGILKAGGAYVPVDPAYPRERMDFILKDSRCKAILTESEYLNDTGGYLPAAACDIRSINTGKTTDPEHAAKAENLAYVTYTSGSTGRPKGVMVTHGNVVSFNVNMTEVFGFEPADRIYAMTTVSFDISVLELLNSLMTGMSVVVSPGVEAQEPEEILKTVREGGVSALQVTPSRLKLILEGGEADALACLRVLLVGGEPLPGDLFEKLKSLTDRVKVFNVYGPTEATIWSTCRLLDGGALNIGSPLKNESIYILSPDNTPVPIGAVGEICVGGDGLARGYYGRPDLTSEKFVPDPFGKGELMYRTGDLGRWLPDGNIECLGRNDNQVKIRGHRVELGEIENCLRSHRDVGEAAVVVRNIGGNGGELAAYVIDNNSLSGSELREHLKSMLPEYMIPSYFVKIDRLPLTPNGKLNKNALPDPDCFGLGPSSDYTLPRNILEEKIAEIWKEVLQRKVIGVHDNFFEIGGHSIKAIQLVSRIRKNLNISVTLREVFNSGTIAGLAETAKDKGYAVFAEIDPAPEKELYDVSHAQRRLWVTEQMEENSFYYNLQGAIKLDGNLDADAFSKALDSLINRHESLRTTFVSMDGRPRQKIHGSIGFKLEEVDLSGEPDREKLAGECIEREARTHFDLSKGPLLRAKLFEMGETSHLFLITMHHIVCDGWSMNVMMEELFALYEAYAAGDDARLPRLRIQYKDYSEWHNAVLEGEGMKEIRRYWHDRLSGNPPTLELPTDHPRPAVKTYKGDSVTLSIDKALTAGLRKLAKKSGASLFMALVSAVNALLHRYTGQEDIVTGTTMTGRSHPDLENQVGFYVNMLPLRVEVNGENTFGSLIGKIKTVATGAFDNQTYPFDTLVEELSISRKAGRLPLFDVVVDLQQSAGFEPRHCGLEVSMIDTKSRVSKYDISFQFEEKADTIALRLEFSTDLFETETMREMMVRFEKLIATVVENPEIKISEIELADEKTASSLKEVEISTSFNF